MMTVWLEPSIDLTPRSPPMLDRRRTRGAPHRRSRPRRVAALLLGVVATTATSYAAQVDSDALSYFVMAVLPDRSRRRVGTTKQTSCRSRVARLLAWLVVPGLGSGGGLPRLRRGQDRASCCGGDDEYDGVDVLTPLAGAFSFGADVNSDAVSTGTTYDNGNNVFQRGLYGEAAQFKVQIDHGYAMCRVKGDQGAVQITSSHLMPTGTWFRVSCARQDCCHRRQAPVGRHPDQCRRNARNACAFNLGDQEGGSTEFCDRDSGLDRRETAIRDADPSASDQFNGLIDNPVLNIG